MGIFGIFGRVIVDGTSMQPTYNPLDWLLVHYGFFGKKYLFLRLGDVVVIERERQPGIFYVKRITEIKLDSAGVESYYVRSDNESGTDSRTWGYLNKDEIIGGTAVDARVLRRISRRASASPATGNHHLHEEEAKALMYEAFTR